MPGWAWLIAALAPTVYGAIKGGNKNQQTTQNTTVTTPASGYSSPTLPIMDMFMQDSLLRNFQGLAGAGMPGGQANISPYLQAIMKMLGNELPSLLEYYKTGNKAYSNPATPPAGTTTPFGAPTFLG